MNKLVKWPVLAKGILLLSLFLFLINKHSVAARTGALVDSTIAISFADTTLKREIELIVSQGVDGLFFPKSVKRFYMMTDYQLVWLNKKSDIKPVWDAMLMLDCVTPYGLAHQDYHSAELTIKDLHILLDSPQHKTYNQIARFEVMLTDAMIRLMNNLHYGKFNPALSEDMIDANTSLNFRAEDQLLRILKQGEVVKGVESSQPNLKPYKLLQDYMRLIKLQYTGDCYETPEETVRLIAMNMERLRWLNEIPANEPYVHINIPAYSLNVYTADTVTTFKALVGKANTPTPTLAANLNYFTTFAGMLSCGDSAVQIQFVTSAPNFALHSMVKPIGNKSKLLARTTGCIQVMDAAKFGELMLRIDHSTKLSSLDKALTKKLTRNFSIHKDIRLLVTYLTCENRDGIIETYKDIYVLDKKLEMAMYPDIALSLRKRK